jgi:hypothetical protein
MLSAFRAGHAVSVLVCGDMKWDFADIVSFGLFVAGLGAIGHIVYALVRFGFCRLSHAARLSGILRLRQSRQGGSFGVTIRVELQRIIVSLSAQCVGPGWNMCVEGSVRPAIGVCGGGALCPCSFDGVLRTRRDNGRSNIADLPA